MKHVPMKLQLDDVQSSKTFAVRPVAAGCAMLLLALSAQAQQATLSTVEVTGIRHSIESAIAAKRNSDSIVEAVSAEDIGKLPDISIAESIARLPGLTAQRVGGRAQTISIRGMSPDFSGTLLNGREQTSTGDNRAVQYDQYPSELLNGLIVYKTPDAALIGQGLAGTVDMQTVRPLSLSGPSISVNVRGEQNSNGSLNPGSNANGNRISASYINQYANRTFGVALGVAHLDTPSQYRKWSSWGYTTDASTGSALVSGGNESKTYSGVGKRDAVMAVLEWKPSKDYTSTLDLFYSDFKESVIDRGMVVGTAWGGGTLSNATVTNGYVSSGTWTGVKPVIWNEFQERKDQNTSIGWNNKWNLGSGWKANADLSYSKSKRNEQILEMYAGTIGTRDTAVFKTDLNTGVPMTTLGLNYADPKIIKMVDSGGWSQDGYNKYQILSDELKALKASATKDINGEVFRNVEFGANINQREKTKLAPESLMFLKSSPTDLTSSPYNIGSTNTTANGGSGNVLAWSLPGATSLYNFVNKNHPDIYNKDWGVKEKVETFYVKANIDTQLAGKSLHGNLGIQAIHTDQRSSGFGVDLQSGSSDANRTAYLSSGGKQYADFLPSVNLAYDLNEDAMIRMGLGKQMARARLDQLRASKNFSLDPLKKTWSGSGGNPELDPFRATAFDLSFERYFGNKAYVSAAGFYKQLDSYIYQADVPKDFSGLPTNGLTPVSNIGRFTMPMNGQGGRISGAELTASMPFNLLTPMLDGFGFSGSYAYTDSSIKPQGPGTDMPLPGLSRHVRNMTVYFEKAGFQARVSERKRTAFIGEIQGFGADRVLEQIAPEATVDAQVGYEFKDGKAKGLSVVLQMNNLTDAPYKTYYSVGSIQAPKEYTKYGRSMLLGVNYKF